MKLGIAGGVLAVLAVIAAIVGYSSLFTVYQTRLALVVRLGQPVRVVTEPGLNFKIPLIDSVIYVDKRILDLENAAQEVIASDQKRLVVDAFARYQDQGRAVCSINRSARSRARTRGSRRCSTRRCAVCSANRRSPMWCKDERAGLMARVRDQLDREAASFGITVVDVRIRRADLPEQNSQAVYQRMQTERQREAAEFRANGSQRKQEIQARADRDVTVLLADAQARGDTIRGEGEAERNRIFADAFNKDPDFFAFYRSMQAYEAGLGHKDTRMVLRPDSDFFRYFADPSGKLRDNGQSSAQPKQ